MVEEQKAYKNIGFGLLRIPIIETRKLNPIYIARLSESGFLFSVPTAFLAVGAFL